MMHLGARRRSPFDARRVMNDQRDWQLEGDRLRRRNLHSGRVACAVTATRMLFAELRFIHKERTVRWVGLCSSGHGLIGTAVLTLLRKANTGASAAR